MLAGYMLTRLLALTLAIPGGPFAVLPIMQLHRWIRAPSGLGQRVLSARQLNDPRQSRGLIFVSPSKGQVHEPPEGG